MSLPFRIFLILNFEMYIRDQATCVKAKNMITEGCLRYASKYHTLHWSYFDCRRCLHTTFRHAHMQRTARHRHLRGQANESRSSIRTIKDTTGDGLNVQVTPIWMHVVNRGVPITLIIVICENFFMNMFSYGSKWMNIKL